MPTKPSSFSDRNFVMLIFYEGPWEKLCDFCWGIRKNSALDDDDDMSFRWVIGPHPKGWRLLLQKLARWAEMRDALWRAKYVIRRKNPPDRWKRQVR